MRLCADNITPRDSKLFFLRLCMTEDELKYRKTLTIPKTVHTRDSRIKKITNQNHTCQNYN